MSQQEDERNGRPARNETMRSRTQRGRTNGRRGKQRGREKMEMKEMVRTKEKEEELKSNTAVVVS